MGRKKAGQDQLSDYIAKNKIRARKSAEKVEEKLRGKRMIPDPERKGCYIYVDAEEADRVCGNAVSDMSDAVIIMQKPVLESNKDFGGLIGPVVRVWKPQEIEVVDELDHVRKFGPSFGSYPVDLCEEIEFEDIPNEKPQGSEIDTIGLKAEVVDPLKLGYISFVDAMIDHLENGGIIKYF